MRQYKNNNVFVQHRTKQETQLVHCFEYVIWKPSAARKQFRRIPVLLRAISGNPRVEMKER